ncbi:hypothetical protein CCACVL1_14477 [Corchorus capsularis]|uniref:Uncharacterized protein n=1 Tax=Corchorus capsularis TaxID=210143 RepID=A0A1R3I6Z3_COCAP|nr:hypothetical protein CCACVL1_14477 [Corchorus capsularis]
MDDDGFYWNECSYKASIAEKRIKKWGAGDIDDPKTIVNLEN